MVPPEYRDEFRPNVLVRNWQGIPLEARREDWIGEGEVPLEDGRFIPQAVLRAILRAARFPRMGTHTALTTLKERLAEISDIGRAAGVLGWEQRVTMPPLGSESRAHSLATLSRIAHERFVDDEIGRLLDDLAPLEASAGHDSDKASLVRVTRRDWEKARRVPAELRAEMTREAARGHNAWVEARPARSTTRNSAGPRPPNCSRPSATTIMIRSRPDCSAAFRKA